MPPEPDNCDIMYFIGISRFCIVAFNNYLVSSTTLKATVSKCAEILVALLSYQFIFLSAVHHLKRNKLSNTTKSC